MPAGTIAGWDAAGTIADDESAGWDAAGTIADDVAAGWDADDAAAAWDAAGTIADDDFTIVNTLAAGWDAEMMLQQQTPQMCDNEHSMCDSCELTDESIVVS